MIDQRQKELATLLGDQLPVEWVQAFKHVPRHLFVPAQALRMPHGGGKPMAVDRVSDEDGWLAAVYSPDIIVTQLAANGVTPTSSCSMPYMVFRMLGALEIEPDTRVLEIGTGTGWTAGLTAYRVGQSNVFSIEVDAAVATGARAHLADAELSGVTVITGDGTDGYAAGAPYDRVHATCTVNRIPYAWVEQCKPGAIIVTPWGTPLDNGALLKLTVGDDGSAWGKFIDTSVFMWLRAQAFTGSDEPQDFTERARESTVDIDLVHILANSDAMFTAGILVPDCRLATDTNSDGDIERFWLLAEDSWASVDGGGVVRQLGRRGLFDEVVSAHAAWSAWGKPDHSRLGVHVTRGRQTVWLDYPSNVIATI